MASPPATSAGPIPSSFPRRAERGRFPHPAMPSFRNKPVDVVLDVRSRLEFWLGHLDGAVNISVDALEEKLPSHPEIGTDQRILVYCASGARSAAAAQTLARLGYRRVTDGGGLSSASAQFVP